MKSFFSMFTKSAKELAKPVNLVKVGMLIAVSMVIEMYSIDLTFFKINFSFLAIAVIGMLFGPTVGLFAGLICDVVGYMVHPNGAFLPAYTLVAGLQGLIYGICLYTKNDGHSIILRNNESKKDIDITLVLRIIIARLIDVVFINIFINHSYKRKCKRCCYSSIAFNIITIIKNTYFFIFIFSFFNCCNWS